MTRGTDITGFKEVYKTPVQTDLPEELTLQFRRTQTLRYAENPSQPGGIYRLVLPGISLAEFTNVQLAKGGKGGLSLTNLADVTRGMNILKYFPHAAVAVMKHTIPSGLAGFMTAPSISLDHVYVHARDADPRSAFGSTVVSNRAINRATAEALVSTFIEIVAAPGYEEGVMDILTRTQKLREELRVVTYSNLDKIPKFHGDDTNDLYDIKSLPNGEFGIQRPFVTRIRSPQDFVLDPLVQDSQGKPHVVARDPTHQELSDLLIAWYVNFGVRSNGIVIVKNGVTISIGSGQQERVGAVEQAIAKAYQKALNRLTIYPSLPHWFDTAHSLNLRPLEGAVVSSDGFFPFRDSIDLLAEHGVRAVVQPGGSKKDHEVIDAVNEHGMAMAFTLERCFAHF